MFGASSRGTPQSTPPEAHQIPSQAGVSVGHVSRVMKAASRLHDSDVARSLFSYRQEYSSLCVNIRSRGRKCRDAR